MRRTNYGHRLVENLVQTAVAGHLLAQGPELDELEETQEIARVSFEPDQLDPLEQTQEIFPNHVMTGAWRSVSWPTVTGGEFKTYERYAK